MRPRLLAAVLLVSALSYAQEFRGAIGGIITDATGATVVGAKIVVSETRTGTRYSAVSDSSGKYDALFLLPGDYEVTVQASGFKESIRSNIHVGSGDHPQIDFHLTLGDATQTVEVSADAPIVNSENSSVGQAITTKEVEDLPMNGRSPLILAQFPPASA